MPFADNVAFARETVQSSIDVVRGGYTNPSCAAVNGNLRQTICFQNSPASDGCRDMLYDKNCILTAKDDPAPYWMVEFDQLYTVAAVEFISAENSSEEQDGQGKICVYVSGILVDWSKTLVLHQNKAKQITDK